MSSRFFKARWPSFAATVLIVLPVLMPCPAGAGVERFSADFRLLTFGIMQQPSGSTQNPENRFLQIPRYQASMELRPDLKLDLEPMELSAKPRAHMDYSRWTSGNRQGESELDGEGYINEWLARWKVRQDLFLSYGRENLQWGPSFLFSPSNPFFQDNGRRNPFLEVPGMDFARLIWLPSSAFTVSLIVNTDQGRNEPIGLDSFEKTYTLKMDYAGRENYGSIILSQTEHASRSLGFLGGLTLSDAILLYGEGSLIQGSDVLYPEVDRTPFGVSLQNRFHDSSRVLPVLLAGGSYTFEAEGTLTVEYVYHGPGYGDTDAEKYFALRQAASEALLAPGLVSLLAQKSLGETASTGLRFLRRHYALLQYTQNNIRNALDLTLRWTQNLDDGSSQCTALGSHALGDHMEIFSVGTVNVGEKEAEFRSFLDYQWMIGLKYSF